MIKRLNTQSNIDHDPGESLTSFDVLFSFAGHEDNN